MASPTTKALIIVVQPDVTVVDTVVSEPKKKAKVEKKTKNKKGIKAFVLNLFDDKKITKLKNSEILELVLKEFPDAKTITGTISKLRKDWEKAKKS